MQEVHHDQHPLAPFKMRASVDFLRLTTTTIAPTQGQHIQARLPPSWRAFADPQPLDNETAAACTRFLVTIQDPPAASAIEKGLSLAQCHAGQIHTLEVSLDLTPRQRQHRDQLSQIAFHLHRHLATPPQATPRITEPGHYRAASRPQDAIRAMQDGFTINTGQKDAAHRTRVYVKRTDSTGQGRYAPLPPSQHRARLEVTLSGPACPVETLADLAAFRFETLAPHLAQVIPTMPSSPLGAMLVDQLPQLGKPVNAKAKAQHRRQSRNNTHRDTVANKRIHDALRRLTTTRQNAEISVFPDPENPHQAPQNAETATASKYLKNNIPAPPGQCHVTINTQPEQDASPVPLAALAHRARREAPELSGTARASLRSVRRVVRRPCTP